jgi:hypothetical protein
MRPFPARLFLLVLLLIDWAADPYQGLAPLVSGPLASTEVTCCSAAGATELGRPCDVPACPTEPVTCAASPCQLPCLPSLSVPAARRDPLYVLMSLQR